MSVRISLPGALALALPLLFISAGSFETEQLKQTRVAQARDEKEAALKQLCQEKGLTYPVQQVFFRAFKEEGEYEMWGRNTGDKEFTLLRTYAICTSSGVLGPKRRQGDGQVPEGFYSVQTFNPQSSFHLSLCINYPNASDRRISTAKHLGNAICIHGNCVSIGCLPLTDDKIKEVYLMALKAYAAGQTQVPVHIFPFRMTEARLKKAESNSSAPLVSFWKNLKSGYDHFEKNKLLPKITVDASGKYLFR